MAADEKPSRDLNKFVIRFPQGMRDQIAEEAEQQGRSMNAEIVWRLHQSLNSPEQADRSKFYASGFIDAIADLLQIEDLPARFRELALALGKRAETLAGIESKGERTLTSPLPQPPSTVSPMNFERLLVDNRLWEFKLIEKEIESVKTALSKMMNSMEAAGTADPAFRDRSEYLRLLQWYAALIANGIEAIENPRLDSSESAEIREFPKGKKAPG